MYHRVLVLLGGVLISLTIACASSTTAGSCDPDTQSCACDGTQQCPGGFQCEPSSGTCVVGIDASIHDAPTDARLKGFGEPCLDKNECESNICILVGSSGGRCTALCGGSDCPPEWGCFGVVDVIEQGTVTEVCVPIVDQLCTACTDDPECVQFGADRCLTYPDGKEFCGRDCRQIGCPTGYTCRDMSAGGEVIRQCVPSSGACDCSATNMGMTEACTIMTPFNTACGGVRTCQGATGWSTCAAPSTTDLPDGGYLDSNCDGIDGEVSRGIFVAGGGSNTPTCGLTSQTPCQTISYGIVRAATAARQHVFVQTGAYNEVVVLVNGIHVWGGYSFGWQRGPYSNPANRVTITGGQDTTGDGEYLAVRAHDLLVPVTIGDVIIDAPNAVGSVGGNGRSSYGVHVDQATVRLERVQILGGNGATGATGTAGTDAPVVDAESFMHGTVGGDGDEYNTACNNSSRGGGGPGGTNTCSGGRAPGGGAGGAGGTMDTSCTAGQCVVGGNCDARAGSNGGPAASSSGSSGAAGQGGSGTGACGPTTPGGLGLLSNGAGGTRQTGGMTSGGYWYARAGGAGGTGDNGGGGGGGGGAGGCDAGTDSYGAGGGGGGAGGCAARGGGGGGGGGGGSFGVFAASGSITLATCQISRGLGADGGIGGRGGRGQTGGLGRDGGTPNTSDGASPGRGGDGRHGGHGGGGAGGQGGRSVGIGWIPGATVTQDCSFNAGSVGSGGPGGAHAPTAPVRDGNDGQGGLGGSLDPTRPCTSASDC